MMISFIIVIMINVTLHGILGKKLGKFWELEVESIMEVFEAVEANCYQVNKYFNDFNKFFTHFVVYIDGKMMPAHLIKSKILKPDSKVEIVPVVQGGWFILVGVILIVLSIVLAVLLSPKAPKDVKTNSTILGGVRNVLNRNIPIPIGYGRMRLGSAVISNDIIITSVDPDKNNFENAYGSLTL